MSKVGHLPVPKNGYLELCLWPNPVLLRKTKVVPQITPELVEFTREMLATMYHVPGVGLAANQVGVSERFAVIDTRKNLGSGKFSDEKLTELEKKLPFPLIMFNPEIISAKGNSSDEEGCLSVPTYFDVVQRKGLVRFKYQNENNESVEFETDGLTAVCVQHEVDHLDGRLFLDRLTPIRRTMMKSKIKKNGYPT